MLTPAVAIFPIDRLQAIAPFRSPQPTELLPMVLGQLLLELIYHWMFVKLLIHETYVTLIKLTIKMTQASTSLGHQWRI